MNQLRGEADAAVLRAEEAEAKLKKYEQELLDRDMQITSFQHQIATLDAENAKLEEQLTSYKSSSLEGESSKTTSENLTRKVQLLEEELDVAEKNVKETVEKCVSGWPLSALFPAITMIADVWWLHSCGCVSLF